MAKSSLCLFVIIFLLLCCEYARGNHEYSSIFEDRLNLLENELEITKAKLVKTEHRLGETELKNKQLEMKLQMSIGTFDLKFKELDDTIEKMQIELTVTTNKLKVTDAELRMTKDELKIVTTTLYTTIANLVSFKPMDSELHTADSKEKHPKLIKIAKNILKDSDIKRNSTRPKLGQPTASKEMSGQRILTHKKDAYSKVKRVDEIGSVIAFHAELGPTKPNLASNATIKFETVAQNFGNAYDPQLGFFNCPKAGLYFFTFTIMANRGKEIETKLVVNGSPIAYSYSAGPPGPPAYHNAGSKSVITYLHPGDRVWVQFHNYNDHYVLGNQWSTFTGFMIKET